MSDRPPTPGYDASPADPPAGRDSPHAAGRSHHASRSRRSVLRAVAGVAGVGALAGCSRPGGDATTARTTTRPPSTVDASLVADGFVSPVSLAAPGGDRLFVADQPGVVYAVADGDPTPFLDLRDRVVDVSGYDERGLLGVAFHPAYPEDDRLFVRYSAPPRPGTPDGYDHTFALSSFRVVDGAARPDTERTVLEIPEPQSNHNAGDLAFGPDGYLYVGVGDGGGSNDSGRGHVDDWYDANAGGNGQDVAANLLGSVLRLDVDGGDPYAVPPDNPLVGRPGLDEQYAWGFRNPWRLSFDGDGRLYVADVGQNLYEEVDVVERGGNYGWNVREGDHCFGTASPSDPPAACPSETADGAPLRGPVVSYPHDGSRPVSGVAVVGGYRYERTDLPALADRYVFADWRAGGRLFAADPRSDAPWPVSVVDVRGTPARYVLAFGRDAAGRLYLLTADQGSVGGSSGAVHRLVPP